MPTPAKPTSSGSKGKTSSSKSASPKGPAPSPRHKAPAPAKKTGVVKAAVKSGGDPEIAAAQYLKQQIKQKRQARTDQRRQGRGGQKVTLGGRELPAAPKLGFLTKTQPRRILLTEFVLCFVVLGAGTIVAPQGSQDGVPRMAVKGSGLAAMFFILALIASGGQKSAKMAAGFGALVTTAYVFTSSDATNVVAWISGFYSKTGLAGSALAGGAQAPPAAGAPATGGTPPAPTKPTQKPPTTAPAPPTKSPPWVGVTV